MDSVHLEVGYGGEEGPKEADDLRADFDAGCFGCTGCAAPFDEREPDFQMAQASPVCAGTGRIFTRGTCCF